MAFGLFITVAASCASESTPRLSSLPVILTDPDETFDPLLAGADPPSPGGLVLGVVIDGEARAYPIDFLAAREMINDIHDEIPTLVSW